MRITIVTLFPEFFESPLNSGLMRRAREAGILDFEFRNPRDKATDAHRSVDDRPYGGGPGMVMLPGPVAETLRDAGCADAADAGRILLLSPGGRPFTQTLAKELAGLRPPADAPLPAAAGTPAAEIRPMTTGKDGRPPRLTLICGRYEGLDARLEDIFPIEAVSVGDFVLNGGEAAALCLIEAVARLLPGFMGHEDSGEEESFSAGLLEYPHYTRPEVFEGRAAPAALLSGDHAGVALWRRQASLARTLERRPDLLASAPLSADDTAFLRALPRERPGRNLYCALVHAPVLDKDRNSVTVSLTNLDIHDIARSSCAYGLGGYYVISPLEDQLDLLATLLTHWTKGDGAKSNPDRSRALALVRPGRSIEEAVAGIAAETGREALVIGTSANADPKGPPTMPFAAIADALKSAPVLLLFGTGQGLAPEASALCRAFAPPLRPFGGYNHFSVRSAAAVVFDRILGDLR